MTNEKIEYLNLDLLHPFKNNPFQSIDESEYNELRDSVMEFGIITPLIANKTDNGYKIISGHRRWQIAKELNLQVVPVYVREFSKEEAIINFVDCNLSREKIMHKLSDEKKLTMDAIFEIMQEQKANQKEYVKIPVETFKKYFKKDMPPKKMEAITEKALARYAVFLQKQRQWER